MTPLLVTRSEAARALRIPPERVDRLVAEGRLAAVQLFGDDTEPLFTPESILRLVDGATSTGPPVACRQANPLPEGDLR